MLEGNNLDDKKILMLMILNAYYAGYWNFSLDDNELERFIPELEVHFIKNEFNTTIFAKNPSTGEYDLYKDFMISTFSNDKWGYYNKEYNEVCIDIEMPKIQKLIEEIATYDREFIEIGSYIITTEINVFQEERERIKKLVLELNKTE